MNISSKNIRSGLSVGIAALSMLTMALTATPALAQRVDNNIENSATAESGNNETAARELDLGSAFKDESRSKFELGLENAFKNAWVDVNGVSYHFKRTPRHNERNWGLGLTLPLSENTAVAVGTYKNSNWRQTQYAWYEYTPWKVGPFKVGFLGGGVTGYRSGNNVMPAAGLLLTTRSDKVGFNVVCLPPVMCAASVSFKVW